MHTSRTIRCVLAALATSVCLWSQAAEPAAPIDVGNRKQLFLDGQMIREARDIRLTFHEPYRSDELLVTADQPWETGPGAYICAGSSVLKVDGKVRLWYDLILEEERPGVDTARALAYAESEDGIHFTKPKLGLCDLRGSTENNLVMPDFVAGGAVWLDPNDLINPYKSQAPNRAGKLVLFQSPNGLRWSEARQWEVGHCDTQTIVFWAETIKRYVLFTRRWLGEAGPKEYRVVRRLESPDLIAWGDETIVMQADEADLALAETVTGQPAMDYYGASVFRYPDAGGLYIMLAQPFWHWRQYPEEQQWGGTGDPELAQYERLGPSSMDVRLAVSRDGKDFTFAPERTPFLRLGPDGSFSSRMVWALPNPIRMGDELWFYYFGMNRDHESFLDPLATGLQTGIGRAILRLDGFASMEAGFSEGIVTTQLLRFSGNRLEVNLDTSGGGYALVELLDEQGEPLPGYARGDATYLCGNSVRMPVTWGGRNADRSDVGALAGKSVAARFILRNCRLYAFQFVDANASSTK